MDADEDEVLPIWFLCCLSNPVGYRSRYALYERFVEHVLLSLGGKLCVVECVYGDGPHRGVPCPPFPLPPGARSLHVPVRACEGSVMWHKENLLNIGFRAVREADPEGSRYLCWIDADVEFLAGRAAVREIVRSLELRPVVQAFSSCLDLGPSGEVTKVDHGFVFSAEHGLPVAATARDHTTWHTGYAWAARAEFLEATGGLFELCVLGSGDLLMAHAFVGMIPPNLQDEAGAWGRRAREALRALGGGPSAAPGYARLVIRHGFHGFKSDRGYDTRSSILREHAFDASTDLFRNPWGVLEFRQEDPRVRALAAAVLGYFRSRNEDVL